MRNSEKSQFLRRAGAEMPAIRSDPRSDWPVASSSQNRHSRLPNAAMHQQQQGGCGGCGAAIAE